jgi:hypothetical protein
VFCWVAVYCIVPPCLSSSCSSVVKLMFVRLMVRGLKSVVGCDSRFCVVCGSLLVGCPIFCSICYSIYPSLLAGCYLLLPGWLSNRLTMWMRILSVLSIVARLVCFLMYRNLIS